MNEIKHIYLVHCDGYIGSYKAGKHPIISYAPQEKFIDFAKGLREDYPDFKLRCIKNEGIEEKIRRQIKFDQVLKNSLQKQR